MRLSDFAEINPCEKLSKGTISKKISMDQIEPHTKYVSNYSIEAYLGGAKFRNGDTIMARITPCLENGKTAYVSILDDNEVGFGSTEYIVFRAKDGISCPEFIYYLTISSLIREPAIKSMVGSSGRQRVQQSVIDELEIPDFSLSAQQHIVDILGSIDNSIEKSEQIISEIERLIHLQFSVFYGGLTTKSTIGKEFECCLGGTPKTTCPEYWDGNINWINSGEVNKLRICNASKKISQLGMEKSATKLLNRGTTVIAITGATLGQVSLLEIDTCANQSVIGISENQIKKDFIYPLIMHHISDLIKKQTGGAQQHINMNDVKSLEIMVPTLTQYRDYSFEVMPLFDLQSSLCARIEKMKELKALYLKKFFG